MCVHLLDFLTCTCRSFLSPLPFITSNGWRSITMKVSTAWLISFARDVSIGKGAFLVVVAVGHHLQQMWGLILHVVSEVLRQRRCVWSIVFSYGEVSTTLDIEVPLSTAQFLKVIPHKAFWHLSQILRCFTTERRDLWTDNSRRIL